MATIKGLKLNFDDSGKAEAVAIKEPQIKHSCYIESCEFFEVIKEQMELPDKFSVTIYHLLCTATDNPKSIFDIERAGECPKGYWRMPGLKNNQKRKK
jgi:hypothetical protein